MNQWFDDKLASESMNQTSSKGTKQWISDSNESTNQWIKESMNQWLNEEMNQWINIINEWVKKWVDETMNQKKQWSNEAMNQWNKELMSQWINYSTNQRINESNALTFPMFIGVVRFQMSFLLVVGAPKVHLQRSPSRVGMEQTLLSLFIPSGSPTLLDGECLR